MTEPAPIASTISQLRAEEDRLDWIENNQLTQPTHKPRPNQLDLILLLTTSLLATTLICVSAVLFRHLLHR